MLISISAARKPQADGRVQLPPAAAIRQSEKTGGKDDATTESPAGDESLQQQSYTIY